jgi:hypothetical protein
MSYQAFVSSTFEDLKDHRADVIRSLRRAGISVNPMEVSFGKAALGLRLIATVSPMTSYQMI